MASVAFSSPSVLTSSLLPKLHSSCFSPKNVLVLFAFPRLTTSRQFSRNGSLSSDSCGPAPRCVSLPPDGHPFLFAERSQSPCKCCTRRTMLTSLGGTILANVTTAENISRAVDAYRSSADMIREAVYPARPGWYEEYYATVMNTTMRSYEAQDELIVHLSRGALIESLMSLTGEKVAGYKRELFSRLNDNVKTVMELGIGTGPNLAYYGGRPSIANVIGVDPNEKMAPYAEGAAVAAGLSPEQFQFVHAVGEGLPLPSASVDAVICTLVLCSVSDVSSTLKEVQRVLRPGGIFLFVEHVAAPEGDGLRFWQDLLDPVQQLVADGCHLKRDTLSFIEAADFAGVDARRVTVSGASLIGPHVVGSACVA